MGLGTNIVYETWQLEYFEGNQNLDIYLNLYKLSLTAPLCIFIHDIQQWSGNLGINVEWPDQAPFIA